MVVQETVVRIHKGIGAGCRTSQRWSARLWQFETGEYCLWHVTLAKTAIHRRLDEDKMTIKINLWHGELFEMPTDSFQTSMTRFFGGRPLLRRNMLSKEKEDVVGELLSL